MSTTNERNYNSISPSARALLLLKGLTEIPFAHEAAALMLAPEAFIPDFNKKDVAFWARVAHFEYRYKSINMLLEDINAQHLLELSSGFSFRSLALSLEQPVHYIDTDLPGVIDQKQAMTHALLDTQAPLKGRLEVLPLNALDETAFRAIVAHFAPGPLTILNEGLLMYLGPEEKEQLCRIIHSLLQERGGYWITSDIYLKTEAGHTKMQFDDKLQHFFEQHHIEDNKFDSIAAAEQFFARMGFVVDKEAPADYSNISAVPYMLASATPEQLAQMRGSGRVQATWRLKVA